MMMTKSRSTNCFNIFAWTKQAARRSGLLGSFLAKLSWNMFTSSGTSFSRIPRFIRFVFPPRFSWTLSSGDDDDDDDHDHDDDDDGADHDDGDDCDDGGNGDGDVHDDGDDCDDDDDGNGDDDGAGWWWWWMIMMVVMMIILW